MNFAPNLPQSPLCLDILPRNLSLPLFLDSDDILELKGSIQIDSVLRTIRSVYRRYLGLHQALKSKWTVVEIAERFHIEDYLWAVGIAMSRQNNVGEEKVLMPLLDMFNHARYGEVRT